MSTYVMNLNFMPELGNSIYFNREGEDRIEILINYDGVKQSYYVIELGGERNKYHLLKEYNRECLTKLLHSVYEEHHRKLMRIGKNPLFSMVKQYSPNDKFICKTGDAELECIIIRINKSTHICTHNNGYLIAGLLPDNPTEQEVIVGLQKILRVNDIEIVS